METFKKWTLYTDIKTFEGYSDGIRNNEKDHKQWFDYKNVTGIDLVHRL